MSRVHVVGVQETRHFIQEKSRVGRFQCFSSRDEQGNLGCQLWVNCALAVACQKDGQEVFFDMASAAIVTSTPRILTVTIKAGRQLFAFVVGHGHTAARQNSEISGWWQELELALRKLPQHAIPIGLLDANSRFNPCCVSDTAEQSVPIGEGALCMKELLLENELTTGALHDKQGRRLVTWRSPYGKPGQLDYVVFPSRLACDVVGQPPAFQDKDSLTPRAAARLHAPLVAKIAKTGRWPFAWSGTKAIAIQKIGRSPSQLSGWRNIALHECAAKGVMRALRAPLLEAFETFAGRCQAGARRNIGIGLPSHYVRSYVQEANAAHVSAAVLFVDGKDAFYSVFRHHLFRDGALESIGKIEEMLKDLHPSEVEQDKLLAALAGPGILEQAGVHTGLVRFLKSALEQSWFAMNLFSNQLHASRSGTVPGTPLVITIIYYY